jgi:hypothetical protein
MGLVTDLMTERYGAPSAGRRRAVVLVSGLVGLLAVGWLGWAIWIQSTPEVSSRLVSFSVQDAHRVSARVGVRLSSADVTASCLLRATAEDHTVVGELNFRVGGREGIGTLSRAFRTEREATTVELVGCTTPSQHRPR